MNDIEDPSTPATPETGESQRRRKSNDQSALRRERAAVKLRENLLRRKTQARARRAGDADETDGLPAAKAPLPDQDADKYATSHWLELNAALISFKQRRLLSRQTRAFYSNQERWGQAAVYAP